MYITDMLPQTSIVHRGLVTYSDSLTGEIRVKVPSILGASEEMAISYIGRTKTNTGTWLVPAVGDQILVTSDDNNFTNLFWIPLVSLVGPTGPTGPTGATGTVDIDILDALFLGIFN
jgi:phage baseplate assembly protein gpV